MKRLPLISSLTGKDASGKGDAASQARYYQTLAERDDAPSVLEAKTREFSGDAPYEPPPGVDRRTFLTLMGASMALAGFMTGCRRPEEKIVPFAHQPEDTIPGRPEWYASALPFYGTAIGVLVESNDGRPTKIEGNPGHPESQGAATAFVQGAVLNLYDPDRSKAPRKAGAEVAADAAWEAMKELGADIVKRQGKGVAILVTEHRSETTNDALRALSRVAPEAVALRYEPFGRENARTGLQIATGKPLETVHDFDKADVVVSLDADFLANEGSPIKAARAFGRRRRAEAGNLSRVYVAEPCPTPTGLAADHRLRIAARRIVDLGLALGAELAKAGVAVPPSIASAAKLDEREAKWIAAAAKDLAKAQGKGLVVAGRRQHPAVHALVAVLNDALGNTGKTVRYTKLMDPMPEGAGGLKTLVDGINGGQIDTLIILGGNPVFNAPADVAFGEALKKVKTSVHLSSHVDETSALATWHIPRAHELEQWSDARSEDGTAAIIQPLIAPLYGGRTDAELLHRFVGGMMTAYELVRTSFGGIITGGDFEKAWRRAVHDGVVAGSAFGDAEAKLDAGPVAEQLAAMKRPEGAFEVAFAADPHAYDGRYANNGWLQELPDAVHKLTWSNCVAMSAATAAKLGVRDPLKDGIESVFDNVTVDVGGAQVTLPAVVTYGHADDSVTVYVGQGRKFEGSVCKDVGVDAGPLRKVAAFDHAAGNVTKAGGETKLAVTQGHFVMEGRPLVREQTIHEYQEDPAYASELVEHPPLESLFPAYDYPGHKWGMAIDLSLCTGCGACVTACMAENNIPVIGAAGVAHSREMHWLRIDRYFSGKDGVPDHTEDDAHAVAMPMLCQHCENAPCEQVCPVAATTHSPEGINEMTYNRCIGTKYCANNCPFKVRRFNYFHYTKEIPETVKLQLNPDVTVRSRGVMEKCTFCVQRVQETKIASKKLSDVKEQTELFRSMQSACQQTCPTGAISFGDLNDQGSRVAKDAALPRAYKMLEEINVRPRIHYLGRVRNPNPELEPPKPAGEHAKKEGGEGHASAEHAKGEGKPSAEKPAAEKAEEKR
jgi:molybdopterin-containing oxidoreductase family iron-sulfur binding subunit